MSMLLESKSIFSTRLKKKGYKNSSGKRSIKSYTKKSDSHHKINSKLVGNDLGIDLEPFHVFEHYQQKDLIKKFKHKKRRNKNNHHSNDENHHQESSNHNQESNYDFIGKFLGACIGASLLATVLYMAYMKNKPRSQRIIAKAIEGYDMLDYEVIEENKTDESSHGTLENEKIIMDGDKWLKKGASDRTSLIREWVISSLWNLVDPHAQPESGLFHMRLDETNAEYFTLSHMREGSEDLEDFIKKSDWRARLEEKPMYGLEQALCKVGLIAGQQDCKFANLIITEYDDHFQVAAIDFEMSGEFFFYLYNQKTVTDDLGTLMSFIRDLHAIDPMDGPNTPRFGLTDDSEGQAFAEYALKHSMSQEAVTAFHQEFAHTDLSPIIDNMKEIALVSDLVKPSDIKYWEKELQSMQQLSRNYIEDLEYSQENSVNCVL